MLPSVEPQKKQDFLYPHQKQAVDRMFSGCVVCGGTGSGKSRTALYYYFSKNGGSIDPDCKPMRYKPPDLYIITTAKKRNDGEWEQEMIPFRMSPDPDLNVLYGNKIVIDSWQNIKRYKDVRDAMFILDECKINGMGTWSKIFLQIARANEWIILSASPADSWEQYMNIFIANGFYRNKTQFREEHLIYDRYAKYPKITGYKNEGRLIRLRNKILIDMPFERHTTQLHEDVYCEYDIPLYRQTLRTRTNPFEQWYIPCRDNAPDALLVGFDIDTSDVYPIDPGFGYIPQKGDWVRLINKPIEQAASLCYALRKIVNSDDSRQRKLLELLEDHPKAIIFYSFDYELDILLNLGYPQGTKVAQYNGHIHESLPSGDKWVYLVNYTGGAEAWNAITTDTIIFFSQTYSWKTLVQAAGRIDRLTTPFSELHYYHLKSRSSIDAAITKALRKKKKFNEKKFAGW